MAPKRRKFSEFLRRARSSAQSNPAPDQGESAPTGPPSLNDEIQWLLDFQRLYQANPDTDPQEIMRMIQEKGARVNADAEDQARIYERSARNVNHMLATGDLAVLDDTIAMIQRAVATLTRNHPQLPDYLTNLGAALHLRFGQTGALAVLREAIDAYRAAVDAAPPGHPDTALYTSNLGLALSVYGGATGELDIINEAVRVTQAAVAATPKTSAEWPERVGHLGASLKRRYEEGGDLNDLGQAVDRFQSIISSTPEDHPAHLPALFNLGGVLGQSFALTGNIAYLEEAISVTRSAAASIPAQHPKRNGVLSNLGVLLRDRFERLGDHTDINEAVDLLRQSVGAPTTARTTVTEAGRSEVGALEQGAHLNNLAITLKLVYSRTGDLSALNEAIAVQGQAVEMFPTQHPMWASAVSNLVAFLTAAFERTGNTAFLDQAVTSGRRSRDQMPANHPFRGGVLTSLGVALNRRFEAGDNPADLDEASAVFREAAKAAPGSPSARSICHTHLGVVAKHRFDRGGDPADLDEAIAMYRQSVADTPPDHPGLPALLSNLGRALQARFLATQEQTDYGEAYELLRSATAREAAPADKRLEAARLSGELAAEAGRWHDAQRGFAAAVELLPMLASRGLLRSDQEHHLAVWAGLAGDAAACSLHAGDLEGAVELVEQGRGVMLSQMLDGHEDVSGLPADETGLVDQLRQVGAELEQLRSLAAAAPPTTPGGDQLDRRHQLAQEWAQLLTRVRRLPGFADFLDPLKFHKLARAAEGGNVVILNVSRYRCDALIVGMAEVQAVPLPGLSPKTLAERAVDFLVGLDILISPEEQQQVRTQAADRIRATLDWLWRVVAEPVLSALGHDRCPPAGESWPRIWWCPTRLLSFLPLHAAGTATAGECVLDRVVSSYTPTLRALLHARDRTLEPGMHRRMLVVAMPSTPGQEPLPQVDIEVDHISELLDATVLTKSRANRENVLDAMPRHAWVHFACHASQKPDDPSQGQLFLHDHATRPLTMLQITGLRLPRAELAFLSACATARGGVLLADECVHVAAALQLAGYSHVVATLWPIADTHAATITQNFYRQLRPPPGSSGVDAATAATALHHAGRELRQRHPNQPAYWASHIHMGP